MTSRGGRPRANIDPVELEKLAGLNCTVDEIAAWFGVSEKTIDRLQKSPAYKDVICRGRAKGRVSIRREQFNLLKKGNATMGVWLGKQLLGQRDDPRSQFNGQDRIHELIDVIKRAKIDAQDQE